MDLEFYYTYITMNKWNTVIYTGVTNNLEKRTLEHKSKLIKGFTKKYNADKLVYFEVFHHPQDAIAREKQIKGWKREKKLSLIKSVNDGFKDLSEEWFACKRGDPSSVLRPPQDDAKTAQDDAKIF